MRDQELRYYLEAYEMWQRQLQVFLKGQLGDQGYFAFATLMTLGQVAEANQFVQRQTGKTLEALIPVQENGEETIFRQVYVNHHMLD